MKFVFLPTITFLLILSFSSCEKPKWKKRGFISEIAFKLHISDSLEFNKLTPIEKHSKADKNFKVFVQSINHETEFLGFDGQWYDCNHNKHDYLEFNFAANKRVKMSFTKTDSTIFYELDYLHRDIREVWGTETVVKHISSKGKIDFLHNNNKLEYILSDSNLDDLIYLDFNINDYNKPRIEVWFECKTCSGNEVLLLYPAETIKERLVGYRVHLWNGYY